MNRGDPVEVGSGFEFSDDGGSYKIKGLPDVQH